MNFNNDNSTQLNIGSATFTPSYSSKTAPNLILNDSTSGIYNPSLNTIKFFTNNIDAFTIDENQCLYGNATGLTNLGYSNIINKPSTFPSDWNTTINKPSTFPSDWNTTINKPSTFNPDLTNIYTKTEVNNITTLTNYYNKTTLDTTLAGKEAVLTFSSPLTRTLNAVGIDLSAYQPTLTFNSPMTKTGNNVSIDLSTYATTTALNGKENTLTFSAPLTRTTNTISIDLSSYLTSATASTTYATITNLNTKENTLTFSAPLTRTTNNISIDLSSYLTSATASTTYATITNLNTKENTLTFSAPLTRTTNNISIDLSSYLTSATASTTYATITNLNTKENTLTFSSPLTRTTNNISIDLSAYSTTTTNNTNYLRLAATTNDLTGKLAILNGNGLTTPQTGFYGGTGDRLILWKGDASAYPYSLGMNGGTLFYSVPTGAIHNFYVNGVSECQINSTGLTVFGNVSTETFSIVDSGSYGANQYQMFMLPPTATTPARIQTIQQGIGYAQNLILQGENLSGNVGIGTLTNITSKLTVNGNITATGTSSISAGSFIEGGVSLASKYLTSASLDTTYLRLNGANSMAGSLNITGSGTNALIFDDNLNDKKIQMNATNGFGVRGDGLGFYSSGSFTFRNSTLTTTLFSVDSAGSMSFNGTVFPGQGVSTSANIRGGTACLGTTVSTGATLTVVSSTQLLPRILLSGQEFYLPANSQTSGIAFLLGVNRTGNKQLWIGDSANLTQNGTTSLLRLTPTNIDCISTNGLVQLPITIGNTSGVFLGGNTCIGTGTAKSITTQLTISGSSSSYSNPLVQITQTAGWDGNYALQVKGYANIGGDGSATGLRINGEDTGNTIYQNGDRDMGLTVNNANMYFNTNGANRMYISGSTGHININNNAKLIFNDNIDDMRIQLWAGYGFGINGGTLRYNTMGNHTFFINGGEIIRFNSTGMGYGNTNPKSFMHLGNCDVAGSSPVLLFGKRLITNNGMRTAFIAYDDTFNFCLGDAGGTNDGISSSSLVKQLTIAWNAPTVPLAIGSSGFVAMAYGHTGASDERIKTNIRTIENALDKTLLLRGVNYNDIRIEPDKLRMGLIAQEVELIIPEVVHTDEKTTMKSIEYQNIVGLLVEAIKELNNKVSNLENIIKKNNLN